MFILLQHILPLPRKSHSERHSERIFYCIPMNIFHGYGKKISFASLLVITQNCQFAIRK